MTVRGARALRDALERAVDPSCPSGELAEAIRAVEPGDFVELCVNNRIAGLVCDRVGASGVLSDAYMEPLLAAQEQSQDRHLETVRLVSELAEHLSVRWLVVRGPVLASHWYGAGNRQYDDLDIVVHPRDFATATSELEALGFEVQTRDWQRSLEAGMAEISMVRDDQRIDLHWDLQPVGELRVEMVHDRAGWFRRAMPVSISGAEVETLSPEDTLLHLCLHGALNGSDALIYLADLRAVIDHGVDWDRFQRLAVTAGTPACVHGILDRARRTVSADVPMRVLRAIAGPPLWGPLFRLVDNAPRGEDRFSDSLRPRRLLRAGRSHWRTTLPILADTSWRRLRGRLDETPRSMPGAAMPDHEPIGTTPGRDAYFDFVARQP